MNDKFGKFAWKIWVPIAGAVVLLVILLATLIPRPVPCDTHFANVTSVYPASICATADVTNVTVHGNGFLNIEGKFPVVTVDDTQVDFTLGDCEGKNSFYGSKIELCSNSFFRPADIQTAKCI